MRTPTIALAVVMLFGCLVAASGGALGSVNIVVTTTLIDSQHLDIGPKGPGIGDTTNRVWRIADRHGRTIGQAFETCSWVSSSRRICRGVYELPLGDIVFSGSLRTGAPLAIIGGTRQYVGVSGQLARHGKTVRFDF